MQIFNCFAISSKKVSLKYLLAAFGRGARPDYSLRMLSQPNNFNDPKKKSKSRSKKKSIYHDRDTIKGKLM